MTPRVEGMGVKILRDRELTPPQNPSLHKLKILEILFESMEPIFIVRMRTFSKSRHYDEAIASQITHRDFTCPHGSMNIA